jgi:hypothetical protein
MGHGHGMGDVACGDQIHTFVVEFECPVIASPPGRCQSKPSASCAFGACVFYCRVFFAVIESCNSTTCVCVAGYLTEEGLCGLEPGPCQLPDTFESQPSTVSTRRVCTNVTTCTVTQTQFLVAAPQTLLTAFCTATQFEMAAPKSPACAGLAGRSDFNNRGFERVICDRQCHA